MEEWTEVGLIKGNGTTKADADERCPGGLTEEREATES